MTRHLAPWMAVVSALGMCAERPAVGDEAGTPKVAWPGMTRAGTVLLPNGWSLKPAGQQSLLGDFPVVVVENPAEPVLAVLHAGYGEHEVITLDANKSRVIGRTALPETFGGLVWSKDGKTLYVGGGWSDVIYKFDHAAGL